MGKMKYIYGMIQDGTSTLFVDAYNHAKINNELGFTYDYKYYDMKKITTLEEGIPLIETTNWCDIEILSQSWDYSDYIDDAKQSIEDLRSELNDLAEEDNQLDEVTKEIDEENTNNPQQ